MKRVEKWFVRELRAGDHVRVCMGAYYHHGIYEGDGVVIHFAGENMATLTDPANVRVRRDPLSKFGQAGDIEVRQYTLSQRIGKYPVKKILANARARLGEGGYDAIYNNCEHFVNACVFGEAYSLQIDKLRETQQ